MIAIALAVLVGLPRVFGVKNASYKAIAHIFVGWMFGAYFAGGDRHYLFAAVGLTVLETVCFLVFRSRQNARISPKIRTNNEYVWEGK